MASFDVPLNGDGNPVSQFAAVLSARSVAVAEGDEIVHPVRGLARSTMALNSALLGFLDAIEAAHRQDAKLSEVTAAFQDLVYRATECLDVFAVDIPKAINTRPSKNEKEADQRYRTKVKGSRDHWSFICNKIKHNHNVLVPSRHEFAASGRKIFAYSLFRPAGNEAIEVNSHLHKGGERSRSFNVALRTLVYDLLRADQAGAELIRALPGQEHASDTGASPFAFGIGEAVKRIEKLPLLAVPGQSSMLNGFSLSHNLVRCCRMSAFFVVEQATVTAEYAADGFTRSFPLV